MYRGGENTRKESREILESLGYTRVIGDVTHRDDVFEDWYINEKHMPNDVWKQFIGQNINMNTMYSPWPGSRMHPKYAELINRYL